MNLDIADLVAKENYGDAAIGGVAHLIVRRDKEEGIPKGVVKLCIAGTFIVKADDDVTHDQFNELWVGEMIVVPTTKFTENLSRQGGFESSDATSKIGGCTLTEAISFGGLNPDHYQFQHFKDGVKVPLERIKREWEE